MIIELGVYKVRQDYIIKRQRYIGSSEKRVVFEKWHDELQIKRRENSSNFSNKPQRRRRDGRAHKNNILFKSSSFIWYKDYYHGIGEVGESKPTETKKHVRKM